MGNSKTKLKEMFKKIFTWCYFKNLLLNPSQLLLVSLLIIVTELVLNILIVEKVPYTEIDWKAYMQECEGFLNGTLDYSKLRGDTGPLVYPAGFVYIYSFLYLITNQGENIKLAQYIFIGIYLLQLTLVFRIYLKAKKVPPYVLILVILTSYRIHSIYVLRLFNDPIAVLLLYVSLNFFLESKWFLGSLFYSLGVSVKMNILLYAPALFFFYLVNLGLKLTLVQLLICGSVQVLLGLPFLISNPVSYIKGSFDIGRVFNHTWTVNYRFLDSEIFENKFFHLSLLLIHVLLLVVFIPMCVKYFQSYCRLRYVQKQVQPQIDAKNHEKKKKLKMETKLKTGKKINEKEVITKEQEEFLTSFEAMLKKSSRKSVKQPVSKPTETSDYSIDFDILTQLFILPMFIVNFIGVVCARSLHYQFYSWYFHSLPYILWSNNFSTIFRFLLLALVEMCWNTYPSTIFSSVTLHICHVAILYGVYKKMSNELKTVAKLD
ncbi:lethal(2)neighbour of tid protein [Bombyx mandarina]|uniref:dolichyl-P-Man:Man5GlcNAc2-PP-dolichol alpha-1,3-mannosyltransferase n=3 Tax=Bombyx TaxID=7090 RepID=A0A8R2C570_BOMMO|nr:lethal(2)neighbour of tid protein isoform X1 [Bombyx mori]XP_028028316.1 lethal(2)neighbour of tid protein [Bombyx mandarina]